MSLESELITPNSNQEEELKEKESYLCTECSSNIEIISLDETNNIISFKCQTHGNKTMSIKDYLNSMKLNTFLFSKCDKCQKQQNKINNEEIFKFCTNCKLIICNQCIFKHDKTHFFIKNNKILTKCSIHPKNYNYSYCLECNVHLCKECINNRKHMNHKKQNIEDIKPSQDEINALLKLINNYKERINASEKEKNNQLVDIKNQYIKNKENENENYNKTILSTNKDFEIKLIESELIYKNELNEIKNKYEKEIEEKKIIFENRNKSINEKCKQINYDNKIKYDKQLESLEIKYKMEINNIEISFKEKINQLKDLLNINDIIYTTYIINKENYFHNINIINLLINYYKKGNDIVKSLENNEGFIEAIKQKDYELEKSRNDELINLKKKKNPYKPKIINKNLDIEIKEEEYDFKFINEDVNLTKTVKEAKWIEISDIEFQNIGKNNFTGEDLYFFKEESSSKEYYFVGIQKDKKQGIILVEDLIPRKISKDNHITIRNEEPLIGNTYIFNISIKSDKKEIKMKNILKIKIKVIEDREEKFTIDEKKQREIEDEERCQKIFEKLEDSFYISSFKPVEEVKKKIRELNFNEDEITAWIESDM